MSSNRTRQKEQPQKPLRETVLSDLTRREGQPEIYKELKDAYRFYVDEETQLQVSEMGRLRKGTYVTGSLLKSSFLRLTPNRRIIMLLSLFLFLGDLFFGSGSITLGFVALLVVLLLELKDKLLIQDELEAGRAVQYALMPETHPKLPGWETWLYTKPAREVGGDLVDYIQLDDNRLGLTLADVADKGLGAALMTVKLQATLRALAPDHERLDALGTHVNTILCRDGIPSRFVSLVYLEIKPESGRVRVLNAGHFPPLVLRKRDQEAMPKGGPALGLTPLATYEEHSIELHPGELLLVYSDGLTEARDEDGAFFEDHHLAPVLRTLHGRTAKAAGERLLMHLSDFVGDEKAHDDLSIIILRRRRAKGLPEKK